MKASVVRYRPGPRYLKGSMLTLLCVTTEPGGYLQWQDVMAPGWVLVDQSLKIDESNTELADFVKALDQASDGVFKRALGYHLVEQFENSGLFDEMESVDPEVVPRLLK